VLGVRRDRFQRLRRGPEENAVDSLLVLESDRGNLLWHGEHNMKIRDVKKFGLAVLKPLDAGQGLTFWAMTIPATVKGVALMTALVAALHMAAESGCSAHFDGAHDAPLPRGHRRAMLFAVGFAIAAEYVRHFQLGTIHEPRRSKMLRRCGLRLKGNRARQQVERTRCRTYFAGGDPQIARRSREAAVPKQQLNRADVGSGFEHVNGEGMSQAVRRNGLANRETGACFLTDQFHGIPGDVAAFDIAGEKPVFGFLHAPPVTEDLPQLL
jgi:hypothetical protein